LGNFKQKRNSSGEDGHTSKKKRAGNTRMSEKKKITTACVRRAVLPSAEVVFSEGGCLGRDIARTNFKGKTATPTGKGEGRQQPKRGGGERAYFLHFHRRNKKKSTPLRNCMYSPKEVVPNREGGKEKAGIREQLYWGRGFINSRKEREPFHNLKGGKHFKGAFEATGGICFITYMQG